MNKQVKDITKHWLYPKAVKILESYGVKLTQCLRESKYHTHKMIRDIIKQELSY